MNHEKIKALFQRSKEESKKSTMEQKVGAVIVVGKSILTGYNQVKTHPEFANPDVHVKTSLHAELACLVGSKRGVAFDKARVFVYRETADGSPALARPCEQCMKFIKELGVKEIYYTTKEFPYWRREEI